MHEVNEAQKCKDKANKEREPPCTNPNQERLERKDSFEGWYLPFSGLH
jgi:hypothetical protein